MNSTTDASASSEPQARNEQLQALLADCGRGVESAFETLYGLCSPQLYGLLFRMLGVEAVAEQALRDTFFKIWKKASTYDPENSSPMAWMSSIARNEGLDSLRRRIDREYHDHVDIHETLAASADTLKPQPELGDDALELQLCLDELDEDVRQCIVNAYCEGSSHEELSVQCGVPVEILKSRIRQGLVSLRARLDEQT